MHAKDHKFKGQLFNSTNKVKSHPSVSDMHVCMCSSLSSTLSMHLKLYSCIFQLMK